MTKDLVHFKIVVDLPFVLMKMVPKDLVNYICLFQNLIVFLVILMLLIYFLFVVMLMNLNAESEPQKNKVMQFAGMVSGGCLFLVMIAALVRTADAAKMVQMGSGDQGLIKNLGKALFNDYVIPFEISSVLFLSAMIGAVVIGKKDKVTS